MLGFALAEKKPPPRQKNYMARREALMQMGETSALTRVEEAVPRFITAAEMYQLGLRCEMLDGDARTVSALLCSARAMFRSNQRELCCTYWGRDMKYACEHALA